ncbi:MAG TPA: hypothetical protein VGG90_09550 [Candidatus Dormibacteraeota bacterium]
MAEQNPAPPAEAPVEPAFTHAAAPFLRTEVNTPVAFASPPAGAPNLSATWVNYKTQIYFALTFLAYLMVVVGSTTIVEANRDAGWRYYIALLPVIPTAVMVWLFVRALATMDELQKRTQLQAFGFALCGTALLTFGYGFLESVGLPHLNFTLVLPLIAVLWAVGLGTLALKQRYRR